MKRIQNLNLAGTKLACRYTQDASRRPVMVTGDAEGVFELPDADADMLLKTNGWRQVREARSLPGAPAKGGDAEKPLSLREKVQHGKGGNRPPKPKLAPPAPKGAPAVTPETLEPEDAHADAAAAVAVRIAGLRTKDDARTMRAEFAEAGYEIPDFSDDDMLLRDMRDGLTSALLAGDEDDGEIEADESETDGTEEE